MKYDKLVRDNIPKIIKKDGKNPKTHIANDQEYSQKLNKKLLEEVNEFLEDPSQEELADILEVIEAICEHNVFKKENLETIRKSKAEKRGKFKEKIILDEII